MYASIYSMILLWCSKTNIFYVFIHYVNYSAIISHLSILRILFLANWANPYLFLTWLLSRWAKYTSSMEPFDFTSLCVASNHFLIVGSIVATNAVLLFLFLAISDSIVEWVKKEVKIKSTCTFIQKYFTLNHREIRDQLQMNYLHVIY